MPIFFSGINSLADILDIVVACHPLISFFFPVLVMFSSRIYDFHFIKTMLGPAAMAICTQRLIVVHDPL